ncbi:hypothetical protein TVAG_340940 [Trichomonas vaginalis G3]|uniref:Bap-like n=1 Tax=Trichomonas vaginalis (strain ATCC PRA-98 / G3) TaxID=412133 RepID=A2DTQ3_TRIV3|nr:hypothetical protein TVAG_340940 [Trichomonas vaginalis G3]|eukprot:XP_001328423.1 hypothetical protein [Trichomonas vaginalis G3]
MTGQLTDPDKDKPIYFFGQFEDEQPFRFNSYTTKSKGGSEPQTIVISTNLATLKVGNVDLNVWASSSDKASGLERFEVSNIYPVKFYINSAPVFYVTFTPSEQYQYMTRNSNIQMQVYIQDDKNVVLNYYLDSKKFKTQDIDVSQGSYNNILTYTIPADESYEWHTLTLECLDNYGTRADITFNLVYYVEDQPKILNATFEPSFALQGETTKIRVQYADLDTHKPLYFWAQFGDQLPETPFYSEFSAGGTETQEFVAGIKIPANLPVGQRTIKIWCDDYQDPEQTETPFASAKFSAQLQVTYTPTMEITQPTKTVYKDGDQIVFSGEINANNNVVLKYSIGDKELSETTTIRVETAPQPFTAKVTIPVDYKFGEYSLNIYGVDTNGLKTSLKKIDFTLRNPPRFITSNLVNDVIKQGDPLLISLTVRDPDVGDDIKIYTAIDDQPDQLSTTLQSTGADIGCPKVCLAQT